MFFLLFLALYMFAIFCFDARKSTPNPEAVVWLVLLAGAVIGIVITLYRAF